MPNQQTTDSNNDADGRRSSTACSRISEIEESIHVVLIFVQRFAWNSLAGYFPVFVVLMAFYFWGFDVDLATMILAPIAMIVGNIWKVGQRIYEPVRHKSDSEND